MEEEKITRVGDNTERELEYTSGGSTTIGFKWSYLAIIGFLATVIASVIVIGRYGWINVEVPITTFSTRSEEHANYFVWISCISSCFFMLLVVGMFRLLEKILKQSSQNAEKLSEISVNNG